MAIAFLEALRGEVKTSRPETPRLSLNQLSELVLGDTSFTDPDNVETRIWRPSLPVIHFCSAIQVLLSLAEADVGLIPLEALLLNRKVIELIIRTAEYHETLLAQSRHLRFEPERMIRNRLA